MKRGDKVCYIDRNGTLCDGVVYVNYGFPRSYTTIHDIERGRLISLNNNEVFPIYYYPNTSIFKLLYSDNIYKQTKSHICVLKGVSLEKFRRQ